MIFSDPRVHAVFHTDRMGKSFLSQGNYLYAGLNSLEPGQEHAAHVHPDQDKLYVVLQGVADVTVGNESSRLGTGAVVLATAGVSHSIKNPGPERLIVLVVFSPPPRKF